MHFRFRRLPPNGDVAEVVMDEKPIGQSKNAKTATFIDWMSKPLRNPQALSSRFIARGFGSINDAYVLRKCSRSFCTGAACILSERFCRDNFRNVRIATITVDDLDDFRLGVRALDFPSHPVDQTLLYCRLQRELRLDQFVPISISLTLAQARQPDWTGWRVSIRLRAKSPSQ